MGISGRNVVLLKYEQMHNINNKYKSVPADLIIIAKEMVSARSWRSPGNRNTWSFRPDIIRMVMFRIT